MASSSAENALGLSRYPYQPLDEPDSIRLLCLNPASSSTAEVRCDLLHTTLRFCADIYGHYTALSYVWGNPNNNKIIWVNRTPFSITVNLYSALRDLRHKSSALQLWTDAICINQRDDKEKLEQIKIIGKIYSMAARTVIYFGPLETGDEAKLDSWALTDFDEIRF
ncbi:HET-domain-containing protein [Stipitochalara longipes BDJ]|nr:HET-domain-containing protein [Stipitochalara longipes BDJ]